MLPDPQVPPSPMAPQDPALDPLLALTWAAAATATVRLATGIIILPQRNPVVLAKQLATLDVADPADTAPVQEDPLVRRRPVHEQPAAVRRPRDVAEDAGAGEEEPRAARVVDVDELHLAAVGEARLDGELA